MLSTSLRAVPLTLAVLVAAGTAGCGGSQTAAQQNPSAAAEARVKAEFDAGFDRICVAANKRVAPLLLALQRVIGATKREREELGLAVLAGVVRRMTAIERSADAQVRALRKPLRDLVTIIAYLDDAEARTAATSTFAREVEAGRYKRASAALRDARADADQAAALAAQYGLSCEPQAGLDT